MSVQVQSAGGGVTDHVNLANKGTNTHAQLDTHLSTTHAPTDAEYVTTASNGSLSAEVNIPGLAGSADRSGINGGGSGDQEFDSSSDPWTWSSNPSVFNSDTTIPSHYYFKHTANSTISAYYAWTPSGAFEVIAKLSFGLDAYATTGNYALGVFDGTNVANYTGFRAGVANQSTVNAPIRVLSSTVSSGTSTTRTTIEWRPNYIYIRLSRDESNNCSVYYSNDGLLWQHMSTNALTFTASYIMLIVQNSTGQATYGAIDFIRTQD